ncbi:hypothetical protein BH20ACT24_BH20ACT24_24120 [soil metagenome]
MGMTKTDRNAPKVAKSSDATTSVFQFEQRFPNDAACLDVLVGMLYPDGIFCPKDDKVTTHYRIKARPAYSCQFCGHLEYPMKGTIFEGSPTSLKLWFYAMYLMASTRCGISAKQLEREVGVSYPTALRMFRQIRSLLDQDDVLLSGTVEMDETFYGGKDYWKHEVKKPHVGTGGISKKVVFGAAQRGAIGSKGKVIAKVADGSRAADLLPHVKEKVLPASTVYTDEYSGYRSWLRSVTTTPGSTTPRRST